MDSGRTLRLLVGAALAAAGAVLSYNGWVAPESRLGGHALDPLMEFGPLSITAGVLVLSAGARTSGPTPPPATARPGSGLVKTGGLLMTIPVILLAVTLLTASEVTGFLFAISISQVGLPGALVLGAGLFRRWRGSRRHPAPR